MICSLLFRYLLLITRKSKCYLEILRKDLPNVIKVNTTKYKKMSNNSKKSLRSFLNYLNFKTRLDWLDISTLTDFDCSM